MCRKIGEVLMGIALTSLLVGVLVAEDPVKGTKAKLVPNDKPVSASTFRAASGEVKRDIDVWRERIKARVEKLDGLKGIGGFEQLSSQRLAVEEMIALVDDLDGEARDILDVASGLGPDLTIYRQSLLEAPVMFDAWGKRFETKAKEVTSSELREAYIDYAGMARKMGASYQKQALDVEKHEAEIERRVEFVREAKVMLGELRELLSEIPNQGGEETSRLLKRIVQYSEAFQQSIATIRGVADQMTESAPEKNSVTGKPASPKAGASTRTNAVPSSPAAKGAALIKRLTEMNR